MPHTIFVYPGHQCASPWLHKYRPELKEEADEALKARFRSGHEVGALAQRLFQGVVDVSCEGLSHTEQLAMTRKLLNAGKVTISEATFQHEGVFVKVDILRRGAAGWEILEVKLSRKVEDHHYYSAALQLHVLAGAGLDVAQVAIVHVDNSYTRQGDIDVQ